MRHLYDFVAARPGLFNVRREDGRESLNLIIEHSFRNVLLKCTALGPG